MFVGGLDGSPPKDGHDFHLLALLVRSRDSGRVTATPSGSNEPLLYGTFTLHGYLDKSLCISTSANSGNNSYKPVTISNESINRTIN